MRCWPQQLRIQPSDVTIQNIPAVLARIVFVGASKRGEVIMSSNLSRTVSAGAVIARQDRIQVWSLPYLFVIVIGLGFLFTFYDIFDINVSFIQTCVQIVPNCVPGGPPGSVVASDKLGLPVLWNLIGYVVGALILSPLADRFGRRDMLLVTMLLTGIGSVFTAFVNDYTMFIVARTLTGIGIGADLAIVNTYINEVAPRYGRARYTSLIFIMSSLGALVAVWLGLLLTTPPESFPLGLSFALAGEAFQGPGWRIMYGIGGALALIGVLLRFQLPESPRWLISQGRIEDADAVVRRMEARASQRNPLPKAMDELPTPPQIKGIPYTQIFSNALYLRRTILLFLVWFIGYVTVYSFGAGFTTILASLHYPPPEAGLIVAVGVIGFVISAVFAYFFSERLERKLWLPIAAVLTVLGGVLVAAAGQFSASSPTAAPVMAFIGAMIVFFGFNIWVPMTYSWSTENYPTRARTTGFGLVDGIGHLGGSVGLLIIAPLIPGLGAMQSFLLISAFLVVAALIAQFGIDTRGKRLDIVSP
ncbi:MAG TPA: MFS transporter [Ktedonobacterales bacterium]|jgi:MFS family permease